MCSKRFLNNERFFNYKDTGENVQFLIDIIKEFNIKHIDYLACNSLRYDDWNKYYDTLKTNANVIVGASNDETGNIKYGGDWLMENTMEDVKNIYFNENIENYTSTLLTEVIITNEDPATPGTYLAVLFISRRYDEVNLTNYLYYSKNHTDWVRIDENVDWSV
jgi:hypothetical protein